MKWELIVKYQALIGILFFVGMVIWAVIYMTA